MHIYFPQSDKPTCSHSYSSSSSWPSWIIEMGCGTSTLLSDNAAIQAKVRPIIRRRIDDIKRRRDLQKGSTPSKKELLAGDDCEKMSSVNNDSLGSECKSIPSEVSVDLKASKIVPVVEEGEEASTIVESPRKTEEEEEENHDNDKKEHDAEETEQENRGKRGHKAQLEMEEHEDEDDDDDGRCISPGSPSFRFYCVEAIPNDTDDDQECHLESPKKRVEKTEPLEKRPASSESSAETELRQKNPETRNNPKKKRNRKFRNVIHKGGQVKSLLKVKSCYNPRCSGNHHGHDKAHLLHETAAA